MMRKLLVIVLAAGFVMLAGSVMVGIARAAMPGGVEALQSKLGGSVLNAQNLHGQTAASGRNLTNNLAVGDQAQGDDSSLKQPKDNPACSEGSTLQHPAAEKLAAEFDVSYDEIIGWFCEGFGFGEIKIAYQISKVSGVAVTDLFDQRNSGMGWGEIMKANNLHGVGKGNNNSSKGGSTSGNGSGNGGGNSNGKDNSDHSNKGNANGHGKGKP
jgi:hypothetical protein